MPSYRRILFWLLLLPSFQGHGFDPGLSMTHHRGVLWAHRKEMLHMEAPTQGFDLNAYLFTNRTRYKWVGSFGYPRIGISLSYLNMGKPELTGEAYGVLPFAEFRLINRKRSELNYRLGTGLGYLTRKWDLENNRLNIAIGTHLNANMRMHLIYHQLLGKQYELTFSAGITHYSNGNIKLPNLGVNSVELGLGLGYNFRERPTEGNGYSPDSSLHLKRSELRLGFASKQTALIYPKRVLAGILGARHYLYNGPRIRIGGGIDLFLDPGYLYRDNPNDVNGNITAANSLEVALVSGGEILMGRLGFVGEGGIYLRTPEKSMYKGPIYQIVGFRYRATESLSFTLLLKAHFARADYFSWGIAYTIVH